MKHIKKFNELNENDTINESDGSIGNLLLATIPMLAPLVWYGAMHGYVKIQNLINFVQFRRALSKIEPIFDKIKDDDKIQELLEELYKYKDYLYSGEEAEGSRTIKRDKAYKIRDNIYKRAKEILNDKEYNIFVSSAREIEAGAEKPASYFTNKDNKFQGWKYTF